MWQIENAWFLLAIIASQWRDVLFDPYCFEARPRYFVFLWRHFSGFLMHSMLDLQCGAILIKTHMFVLQTRSLNRGWCSRLTAWISCFVLLDISWVLVCIAFTTPSVRDICTFAVLCSVSVYEGHSMLYYKTIRSALHNKSKATKRSRDRKENGKCTNAMNCRSRVGLSTSFCIEVTQISCKIKLS